MIWIVSGFVFWLLIAYSRQQDRIQAIEAELVKVRNTFRKLADERKADQVPAVTAPTGVLPVDATQEAPDADTAGGSVEPPPQPAAVVKPVVEAPARPPSSVAPGPGFPDRIAAIVKGWFTEGNVPVKVGVVVTFFGITALLRYAYVNGYFSFPIEYRLLLVATAALAALAFGWRERDSNPSFALSLQGGAIGTLMLVVFSAFRQFELLPAGLSFALIVVLVVGAAALAVLQNAVWIALLGFLGGYLAPVLITTGSGNHVALFGYYALLNGAVFAIAWMKSWRALNLTGFAFTFGVGTLWGARYYRPELFNSVEPFLILFFLFYVVIGLLYVLKQAEHRRPWVDGTLVFGTPLLAFPLQAKLLEDNRLGLAFSAFAVSLVYCGMLFAIHRRRNERLLVESYAALALIFSTLAVPLAFSSAVTSSVWALEGVGVAWLGLRQRRTSAVLAGLLLQVLAAGAYAVFVLDTHAAIAGAAQPILNPFYFGAALIALSGFLLSLLYGRLGESRRMAAVLFVWAGLWWFGAALGDFGRARAGIGIWPFGMLYLAFTMAAAGALRSRLAWDAMGKLAAFCMLSAPMAVLWAAEYFGAPLLTPAWAYWAVFAAAALYTLWQSARDDAIAAPEMRLMHLIGLWTAAFALSLQWHYQLDTVWRLAQGWYASAVYLPLALLTLALWRRPGLAAWPMQAHFAGYRAAWFTPAFAVLALAWLFGLFLEGSAKPVVYVPLLNPLELSLVALACLLALYARQAGGVWHSLLRFWPYAGLAFMTLATLRAVHHLNHQPWSGAILATGITQTSLTIVWSLLGVAGLISGSRRGDRRQWIGGGMLMLVVLAKLILIDRTYMGNMPGIVSFMAVGLLLVAVGYFAPQPPKYAEAGAGEAA
jgi:uncharacterized membrane protein